MEAESRLGRARRPGLDTRVRRYISKQLRLARDQHAHDPDELRRIGVLQQVFLDHLPANVVSELKETQRMELTGPSLIGRLEAIRGRHRLNPPEGEGGRAAPANAEVVRIICSDGLV